MLEYHSRCQGTVGVQFATARAGRTRIISVSESADGDVPGLRTVLEAAAALPGSKLEVVSFRELRKRHKAYIKTHGKRSQPWTHMRHVVTEQEEQKLTKKEKLKHRGIHNSLQAFADFLAPVARDVPYQGRWRKH